MCPRPVSLIGDSRIARRADNVGAVGVAAVAARVAVAHVAVAVAHIARVAVVGKQSRLVVNETGQRMEGANTVAQEHFDQLGGSQLDSLLTFQ